ncbi:unnamed protein product [Lymnaea stagnalis]|uniref:E3 ubiquitin-protein ligase n=1 Tax=Lymnaea stagnalis TaxID=6523 RepID=A0AAV2H1H0_LYMST
MSCFVSRMDVSGYTGKGTIEITYIIGGGRTPSSPGKSFPSSERTAYLPATDEGFDALRLLRIAFLRRLIFKMDASNPAGITWNIQHKTSLTNSPHGYPDPTYLTRLMQELKDNGVRLKSMSEEEENLSLEFVERVMKTKITRN